MTKFRSIQNSLAYGFTTDEVSGRTDLDFYKQSCSVLENFVVEAAGGVRKRAGFRAIRFQEYPIRNIRYYTAVPIKGTSNFLLYSTVMNMIYIMDSNMDLLVESSFNVRYGTILQLIQVGDIFIATMTNSMPIVIYSEGVNWFVKSIGEYLIRNAIATNLTTLAQEYRFVPFKAWNIDQSLTIEAAATTGNTTLTAKRGTELFPLFYVYEKVGFMVASNYLVSTTWSRALWKKLTTMIVHLNLTGTATGFTDSFGATISNNSSFTITSIIWPGGMDYGTFDIGEVVYVKKVGAEYQVAKSFDNLIAGIYMISNGANLALDPYKVPLMHVNTILSPANTGVSYVWSTPQWSVENGFPTKLTFVGTRLVVASTKSDAEGIWMSAATNILQFNNLRFKVDENAAASDVGLYGSISVYDAHLTRATAAQFNRISWLMNAQELTVGCEGGLYLINRSDNGDYQPLATTSSALSFDSSKAIAPQMMEFGIIFVDQTGTKIMFVDYRAEKQIVTELSLLINDSFVNITKILYHRSLKTLWIVDNNTILYSFTLSSFTNVAGFAKHSLFMSGKAGFVFNDLILDSDDKLCLLYTQTATNMLLFMRLETNPSNGEKVYLDGFHTLTNGFSSVTWDFRNQACSIDYREMETVSCIVDGVETTGTVRDGVVTTAIPGLSLIMGSSYVAKMKTLNLDVGGSIGTGLGAIKRVDEVIVKFKQSKKVKLGGTTLYPVKAMENTLFTGEVVEKIAASPNHESYVTVESNGPFPCHIIYLVYKGFTQE